MGVSRFTKSFESKFLLLEKSRRESDACSGLALQGRKEDTHVFWSLERLDRGMTELQGI